MTNREMDALVGEYCMGWQWWVNTKLGMRLIVGPEPEWVRWNWIAAIMRPWNWDADVLPFSDWDRGCDLRGSVGIGLPKYSTNPAASKALRDKMRADGWNYDVHGVVSRNFHAEFYRPMVNGSAPDTQFDSIAHTEEMAVALAALRAVGVEVSND